MNYPQETLIQNSMIRRSKLINDTMFLLKMKINKDMDNLKCHEGIARFYLTVINLHIIYIVKSVVVYLQ